MGVSGVMCECNIITQVSELPKTWKNPTEKTRGCVERTAVREREPFQANGYADACVDSTPARE